MVFALQPGGIQQFNITGKIAVKLTATTTSTATASPTSITPPTMTESATGDFANVRPTTMPSEYPTPSEAGQSKPLLVAAIGAPLLGLLVMSWTFFLWDRWKRARSRRMEKPDVGFPPKISAPIEGGELDGAWIPPEMFGQKVGPRPPVEMDGAGVWRKPER